MVIIMVSHGYPPTISGVTLVVQKLSRNLVKKGHRVVVITASDRGRPYRDVDQGVELIRVRGLLNPAWSDAPIPFLTTAKLKALISEVRPDLVHSHENAIMSLQLLRIKKHIPVPVISSCYYLPAYIRHYLPFGKRIGNLTESLIWKWAIWNFSQFDYVVFSTPTHYEMYRQHGLTVPARPVSNGVDLQRYQPPNERGGRQLESLALPPRPRILFVSRLARDKRIGVLIQAMAQLKADCPAHLLLVGKGDDRPRLERMVRRLGLEETVHFLGFVPEETLPQLFREVEMFAIASICEVQSLPVLQAAASGLPIVAANAGALPELVHDGQNGFLVNPGRPEEMSQAIRQILTDSACAGRMGQASREIARQHGEEATYRVFETLYESIPMEMGFLRAPAREPTGQAFS